MIGSLTTVMLVVSDMARSVQFYKERLGLAVKFESPHWSALDAGTVTLALHPEGHEIRVGPGWGCTFGFEVENLEGVFAELRLSGVVVVTEPHRPQFGGWLAAIADPDGYPIQLYEPG